MNLEVSESIMMNLQNRIQGCLLGLAVGDAVGTTLEFKPRDSYAPLTDMIGGGPFSLNAGEWTDDTSMALCIADSLLACGGFDAVDQMQRYVRWYNEGYRSSNGKCFDIGMTVSSALRQYESTGEAMSGDTDPMSAGNGCIMRLAPVPMYFHHDLECAIHTSGESSRTTHGAEECVAACQLFGAILWKAINGRSKSEILTGAHLPESMQIELPVKVQAIADGAYSHKMRDEVRGNGYVVDALEAALWCFAQTENYRDAVLLAANLGDDADTTAAICGQVAGAYYGRDGMPVAWLNRVTASAELHELSLRLLAH
jgi:ADP-ribosyl-[dinitrogen reductase] hydrolase